ncbi:MFS general substrate transporter [Atractiella rhizophila]|nr:MFS general substrate transporter [Atractiella rhizophila]
MQEKERLDGHGKRLEDELEDEEPRAQDNRREEPEKSKQPCQPHRDEDYDDSEWLHSSSHPRNFPRSKKWRVVVLVSLSAFISTFASSLFVPSFPLLRKEPWGVKEEKILLLSVSAYVLGLGAGPFLWAPISELYGRRPSYLFSVFGFLIFNIACGVSHSMAQLIIFRLLAGSFASSGPGLGAASVGDVFASAERGGPVSVYSLGPIAGPIFGSLAGSYIKLIGWRWAFWVLAILSGSNFFCVLLGLQETYEPVLKRLFYCRSNAERSKEVRAVFARTFSRPPRMLANPICLFFVSYYAYVYAIMYVAIVAIPTLFGRPSKEDGSEKVFSYQWADETVGLAYIPLGIGFFFAVSTAIKWQDSIYARLKTRNGDAGMFLFPPGLLLWGWTAQSEIHWIVPAIGEMIFGYGIMLAFASIQLWLVEFSAFAAAAVAAGAAMRSAAAAVLPIFTPQMYQTLGWGWGGTVLAGAGAIAIPAPAMMFWRGKGWRERWKFEG